MTPVAYYEAIAPGRVRATSATVGPWDPRLQHGSPPAALLAHAIERAHPREGARIARVAFDFLGPVPVAELDLATEVLRPGARVELARATLSAGGRAAMTASAWRIATAAERAPLVRDDRAPPPLPGPHAMQSFVGVASFGYADSLEWRFAEGAFDALGPAAVWTRPRTTLFDGEPLTDLERLLVMVDSANGISAPLPPTKFTFVPVELSVSVRRHPRTEWVGMRARTHVEPDGVGTTTVELWDEAGHLGAAQQTLFVAPAPRLTGSGSS